MALIDEYRLDTELGSGGAGTVWRATKLGPVPQAVAVKRLHPPSPPEAAERLRHEATVLADLDHPHIIRILDVVDDGASAAIVMPLARGGSLADLLAERGRLAPGEVVAVGVLIAQALSSAHRRGLVHGDVKPSNILFTADGEPLLADFGATTAAGRGAVAGTVGYMAPEVQAGGPGDERADVYGLGATCLEALCGHPPERAPPSAGDRAIPPVLAAVIEAALVADPVHRLPAVAELASRLRESVPSEARCLPGPALGPLTGVPATAPRRDTRTFGPRPPPPPAAPPGRRWGPAAAVAAPVAAVIVAALVVAVWSASRRDHRPATAPPMAAPGQPCPSHPPLAGPTGAQRLTADLDGDGCPVPVLFDGQVLSVRPSADAAAEPARYRFDRRGQLVFGDWDCDGRESPALYLPGAGEVVYYDALADLARERGEPAVADGSPRVTRTEEGCDEVRVDLPPI